MTTNTRKALIVVRTYPTPAKSGIEVSCTAAITEDGKWLRLFPVPYRRLLPEQQFSKYQWIQVAVQKATDPRPESHKIQEESLVVLSEVLPSDHYWDARKRIVAPLIAASMCAIRKQRDERGSPTLGLFRPAEIERLIIAPAVPPDWTDAEREILSQGDLFDSAPPTELEKIPFDFSYRYRCSDADCKGHEMKCTDWEMGQSYRSWRAKYGDGWEAKFRERYEHEIINKLDTHFYVGTLNAHPSAWIIVGLFYPPKFPELPLLQGL